MIISISKIKAGNLMFFSSNFEIPKLMENIKLFRERGGGGAAVPDDKKENFQISSYLGGGLFPGGGCSG